MISMHIGKGKTLAKSLENRLNYALNPDKTNDGEHISSYMCDPFLATEQFLLSKKIYEQKTGRKQKNDVICYQIRQSFKPDEIAPELANEIGYQLAEKISKGNNAFLVTTHTDRSHIHNHIYINSTNLDCKKKFRDFLGSGRAIAKISDLLCLKNGLSIVENPKGKSKHYGEWLGDEKPPTLSDKLRICIDEILTERPKDFDEFLIKMREHGYEIKAGKHLAFKGSEQKKFIRLRSLGDEYSMGNIRDIIGGIKSHTPPKRQPKQSKKVSLLIDLQSQITAGKGKGYERWAKTFNIKQLSKTMNYLTENNLLNYEDLKAKSDSIKSEFSVLSKEIKDAEKRMAEISTLQKNIIQFAKTKPTQEAYKKSGYSAKFKEQNIADILLNQAAKNYFKEIGLKKLPKMQDLKNEYDNLLTNKKKAYSKYSSIKKEKQDILNAKQNVEQLLDIEKLEEEPQNYSFLKSLTIS